VTLTEQAWRSRAACRGMDVNLFYPLPHAWKAARAAKAICRGCPVRAECLDYNLTQFSSACYVDTGIWGGTSATERLALRRARRLRGGQG